MSRPDLPSQLRPRKQPSQQRSTETRARILEAARAVFGEHGYAHGTTNKIAERAGMSVGSLYQYFPNKDAILVELADEHIDAGLAAVQAAITRAAAVTTAGAPVDLDVFVGTVVDALVTMHATDRRLHRVLFEQAPRPPSQVARLRAVEVQLVAQVATMLDTHPDVRVADVELAARLVVDAIESLVHRVATDDGAIADDPALAGEITRMITAYLRGSPTRR